ncbi:hypothetical protein KY366_05990 [Candidatus Woesearchaeota archaeon]|nr:hypothetical protein [Candidatus Woesearchaeota archaeon]
MNIPCMRCKGAAPMQSCGRAFCPIIAKSEALFRVKERAVKENFSGSSYSVFVGRYGYPDVNVGILSPPQQSEDAWLHDAPIHWADHDFQIGQIIDLRGSLLNSRFRSNILDARKHNKFLEIGQELSMASKPADIEVNLDQKPRFRLNTDAYALPMGPNANLKGVELTENPRIPTKIDKVVSDTDLKANEGLNLLYSKSVDENVLTKLLSIGNLGLKKNRKLVPTRNSITAVDDNLGKELITQIKQYNEAGYLAYYGGYLGNNFLILFFPGVWGYELFEMYMPKSSWNISSEMQYMTDHEPYEGRKTYADSCGGGYYASRLPVLEKLSGIRRQASVLVLRFIDSSYWCPLGVWVVRSAVRKALDNRPLEFSSKELMLRYAKHLVNKKFGYNVENLLNKSILLRNLKQQTKLAKFLC